MRTASILVWALVMVLFSGRAHADGFSSAAAESISGYLPTDSLGNGGPYHAYSAMTNVGQPNVSLDPIGYGNSVTAYDPEAGGIYTASSSANVYLAQVTPTLNGVTCASSAQSPYQYECVQSLRAWLATQGGTADPYLPVNGQAQEGLSWTDTLTVHAPVGITDVRFLVTNRLDGSLQLSGDGSGQIVQGLVVSPPVGTGPGCGEASLENVYTTSTLIDSTQHFDLCAQAGEILTISEYLNASLSGYTQWSATGNLSDTAIAYIDPLTPGATLTSASGLSYSTPASTVPEPGTLLLVGAGLLVWGSVMKRTVSL